MVRIMRKILHSDMDECWLDISGYNSRDPETVAYEIKETMKEELGLTVSVGVSYNKIFAKLGSDMKKPDAVTVIPKDTFREKIWGLPASDLLFVGRATERFLNRFYIRTIGDLANTDPDFLKSHIGVNGIKLWRYANGLDNSPVMYSDYRPIVKSVGHGTTTVEDLKSNKEVWITILELTQDIGHRLKILGLNCMGISICIRNEDLMFKEWQRKLNFATQSPFVIAKLAYDLFLQKYVWNKNIRSVSTKGQVDKNDIPMQKQSCREFAQRQGWCIVKEFQEKGISGYKVSAENRDAMIELRKAAERKEFDILLVFMFDRIGRMDDETPYVVKWFIKHGIRVWSVVEGEQRMDNHVDKLMNYIRFWQANGESEKTSTRVKTRLSQMVQEGMYTGGNVPYGYKLVKSGQKNKKGKELMMVVIDEDEDPIIKSIFSMTLREGYGSYQIAKQLNEKGLRTHRGSKFQANTIRRILRNKMFCGYLIAGENESPHLPDLEIISENVFKQVQFIMDQRSAKDDEKKQIALRTKGKTQLAGNMYC